MESVKKIFSKYTLAIILGAASLVIFVWTLSVPFPAMRDLNVEINGLSERYDYLMSKKLDESSIIAQLEQANAQLDAFEQIFPAHIFQEETLRVVQNLEEGSGLTVMGMAYEQLQYDTLNQPMEQELEDAAAGTVQVQPADGVMLPVSGMGMKIPIRTQFDATYDQMMDFVTDLSATEQRIGLREIQMNVDKERLIRGSVMLEFYGFMPEPEEEETIE